MKDVVAWARIAGEATTNAMSNLSVLLGREISVTSFTLKEVPVQRIADLVGGPDVASIGIYLTFSGSAEGHIMLMYDPKMGLDFVDMLMDQPPAPRKCWTRWDVRLSARWATSSARPS